MHQTPTLIDEQVKLEHEAISQGLKRLTDQTIKLENQSYASAAVYGIASINTLVPLTLERIDKTNKKIHEGHYGHSFKDIHVYLNLIDSQSAAVIACKLAFDKIFSYKQGSNIAINVSAGIGRVGKECRSRWSPYQ